MGLQGSCALAPWLHACSPGSACSGIIRYDPWPLRFLLPRRPCHQSSLRPAGRYPKDFLAVLSGETLTPLRADASTATPANAPTSRVSDVSWTSLVSVREQYTAGSGAVSSGERYPPFAARRSLRLFGSWNCCPTNSGQLYPTLQVSSRPTRSGEPGPTSHLVDADEWVPDSAARFRDDKLWVWSHGASRCTLRFPFIRSSRRKLGSRAAWSGARCPGSRLSSG